MNKRAQDTYSWKTNRLYWNGSHLYDLNGWFDESTRFEKRGNSRSFKLTQIDFEVCLRFQNQVWTDAKRYIIQITCQPPWLKRIHSYSIHSKSVNSYWCQSITYRLLDRNEQRTTSPLLSQTAGAFYSFALNDEWLTLLKRVRLPRIHRLADKYFIINNALEKLTELLIGLIEFFLAKFVLYFFHPRHGKLCTTIEIL